METIEEFEAFVRDRVVALHMGLPQKISARKLSYAIGQSAGYINKIETGQSLPSLSGLYSVIFDSLDGALCSIDGDPVFSAEYTQPLNMIRMLVGNKNTIQLIPFDVQIF